MCAADPGRSGGRSQIRASQPLAQDPSAHARSAEASGRLAKKISGTRRPSSRSVRKRPLADVARWAPSASRSPLTRGSGGSPLSECCRFSLRKLASSSGSSRCRGSGQIDLLRSGMLSLLARSFWLGLQPPSQLLPTECQSGFRILTWKSPFRSAAEITRFSSSMNGVRTLSRPCSLLMPGSRCSRAIGPRSPASWALSESTTASPFIARSPALRIDLIWLDGLRSPQPGWTHPGRGGKIFPDFAPSVQWDGGADYAIHGNWTRELPPLDFTGVLAWNRLPKGASRSSPTRFGATHVEWGLAVELVADGFRSAAVWPVTVATRAELQAMWARKSKRAAPG